MILFDYIRFLVFCFLIIIPMGELVLRVIGFRGKFWETLLITTNVGFIFTTLIVYIAGLIGINNILPVLILLPFFYLLIFRSEFYVNWVTKKISLDVILLIIITAVVILQGALNFFSGEILPEDIRLTAGHAHDSLWHISLINNLKIQIPPENPIYSGTLLTNYHYFTDIFMAFVSNFTNISTLSIYFKIMGPFLLILFSGSVFLLSLRLTANKLLSYMAILLTALSSNLYYLIGIFYENAKITPSVFWVDEFATRMTNLQLLASYVVILTILNLMLVFKEKFNIKTTLILSIIIASLLGFKAYGFILIMLSLLILFIYRRSFNYLKLSLASIFFSLIIYKNSISSNNFPFIFMPFWFIKNMFETGDHLNYPIWELKRQTYLQDNNYFRIGTLYIEGIIVFLLGNLGGKIAGFLTIFQKYQKDKIDIIIILTLVSILGTLISFTFLQKGIVWNTIQFFYYSYLSLSLLFILFISRLRSKVKLTSIIILAFIWGTLLPGVFYTLDLYSPNKSSIQNRSALIDASFFLKNQDKGNVVVDPLYYQDSLIPALSEQSVFMADSTLLNLLLINDDDRDRNLRNFFDDKLEENKFNFLENNNIRYIISNESRIFLDKIMQLKKIYSNSEINIYKNISK